MSRKIRKVPENWEHPKNDNGNYQPMYDKDYLTAITEWINDHNLWLKGEHPDQKDGGRSNYKYFAEWDGNAPEIAYYRPYKDDECTHYQLYEDTSEGTPISPVMATIDEIAEYAAKNCTTFADFKAGKEQWLRMLKDDFVHHSEGNVTFI